MLSLRHLSHTPTCIAEEIEAVRVFFKDQTARRKEFLAFVREFPELRIFLSVVENRLGPSASATLWLRIWLAMGVDRKNGSTATVDALSKIRKFEASDIEYPPHNCQKPLSFYIEQLDMLIETT